MKLVMSSSPYRTDRPILKYGSPWFLCLSWRSFESERLVSFDTSCSVMYFIKIMVVLPVYKADVKSPEMAPGPLLYELGMKSRVLVISALHHSF